MRHFVHILSRAFSRLIQHQSCRSLSVEIVFDHVFGQFSQKVQRRVLLSKSILCVRDVLLVADVFILLASLESTFQWPCTICWTELWVCNWPKAGTVLPIFHCLVRIWCAGLVNNMRDFFQEIIELHCDYSCTCDFKILLIKLSWNTWQQWYGT